MKERGEVTLYHGIKLDAVDGGGALNVQGGRQLLVGGHDVEEWGDGWMKEKGEERMKKEKGSSEGCRQWPISNLPASTLRHCTLWVHLCRFLCPGSKEKKHEPHATDPDAIAWAALVVCLFGWMRQSQCLHDIFLFFLPAGSTHTHTGHTLS